MNAMTYKGFRNSRPVQPVRLPVPATSSTAREVMLELKRAGALSTEQAFATMVERTYQLHRYAPGWLARQWANLRWNPLTLRGALGELKKLGLADTHKIKNIELFYLTPAGLHASL